MYVCMYVCMCVCVCVYTHTDVIIYYKNEIEINGKKKEKKRCE